MEPEHDLSLVDEALRELPTARPDFGNARRPGETVAEFFGRRNREQAATLVFYEECDCDDR